MPPSREARQRRRAFVAWLKERFNRCQSCRRRFRSHVLDFAHIQSDGKDEDITVIVVNGSTERLLREIALCGLLCSNCHREETFEGRTPTRSRRERKAQWTAEELAGLYDEWGQGYTATEEAA